MALGLNVREHGLQTVKIAAVQLFDAAAGVAVDGLCKAGVPPVHKALKIRRGRARAVHLVAAQIRAEAAVELVLVVDAVDKGRVVHVRDELLVTHAGQIGVPLGGRAVKEPVHHIIVKARAVARGAPQHIREHQGLRLAAQLVAAVEAFVDLLHPKPGQNVQIILHQGHGRHSFRFAAFAAAPIIPHTKKFFIPLLTSGVIML